MDPVVAKYKEVLGIKEDRIINAIIDNLDQNKATSTYFTNLVKMLEPLDVENGTDIRIGTAGRRGPANEIHPEPIAKGGSFSELYENKTHTKIYKKITIEGVSQHVEYFIRQTF
jgi:hypothetical protein